MIDQTRSDASRLRGGKEVFMPPRPGEETLVLVDRRSARAGEAEAAAAVTGLSLDVIFPVLHGPYGEDGTIQGLLELANVAYVGAGVLASAVGMDKAVMKVLFQARGLRVSDWMVVFRARMARLAGHGGRKHRKTRWVFRCSSSRRTSARASASRRCTGPASSPPRSSWPPASIARSSSKRPCRTRARSKCGVLGNASPEASVPGEIVPSREFYDYEAKYLDAGSRTEIPARLDDEMAREVRRQAVTAFLAIDGAGFARVDFLLSRTTGELFINEINTIPGFTTISMFSKMWGATGLDYPALVDRLIALALERHAEKQESKTTAF